MTVVAGRDRGVQDDEAHKYQYHVDQYHVDSRSSASIISTHGCVVVSLRRPQSLASVGSVTTTHGGVTVLENFVQEQR